MVANRLFRVYLRHKFTGLRTKALSWIVQASSAGEARDVIVDYDYVRMASEHELCSEELVFDENGVEKEK